MGEINLEWLQEQEEEYKNNAALIVLKRAAFRNPLKSIVYEGEERRNTAFKFSIEVETLPVANQKSTGRCWMFAGLNLLREQVAKKYGLSEFELSQSYLAFFDKLEKFNDSLSQLAELRFESNDNQTKAWILKNGVSDGGEWYMFVNLVKKYGVVPDEAMPKSYASDNSGEVNKLLSALVRKFNAEIEGKDWDEIQRLKDVKLKEAYKLLVTLYGVPPRTIDFEFVNKKKEYIKTSNLTPHEFFTQFVGDTLDDYLSVLSYPLQPYNKTLVVNFYPCMANTCVHFFNVDRDTLNRLALEQIKNKELIWFACDCLVYGDRQEGVWDDKLYRYNDSLGIDFDLPTKEGLATYHYTRNHGMVFTGVSLDKDGNPTKWKIENSWGPKVANNGYYVCSDSWFKKYVFECVINKKYLSEELLNKEREEPVHITAWDPILGE